MLGFFVLYLLQQLLYSLPNTRFSVAVFSMKHIGRGDLYFKHSQTKAKYATTNDPALLPKMLEEFPDTQQH